MKKGWQRGTVSREKQKGTDGRRRDSIGRERDQGRRGLKGQREKRGKRGFRGPSTSKVEDP